MVDTAKEQALKALGSHIASKLENEIFETQVEHGELTLLGRAEHVQKILSFLRDDPDCLFRQLMDICGVDYPARPKRFDVVYHLLSVQHNMRVRLKVATDADTAVPSACDVFKSANWFEREAWDMYGIFFAGHEDLRRILTDYGFQGHPLRKDFPLTGFVELHYSENEKRVVYEPVKLAQEFRDFDFLSPWESAHYILPDAQKNLESQ